MKKDILEGKLYKYNDSLKEDHKRAHQFMEAYNTFNLDNDTRKQLLENTFKHVGKNAHVNPPLYIDYGYNISIGDNFYANFDCIFLDVNTITIGNNCLFGPRVSLYTAGHPIDKAIRNEGYEFGYPITIGNDVWVGGNVVINPGVTIGNGVVVASGSVVSKDIEDNVLVAGVPARVIRKIDEADKRYWQKEKERSKL